MNKLIKAIVYFPFYFMSQFKTYRQYLKVSRQPIIIKYKGSSKLTVGENVTIGNSSSPGFLSYSFIEIRVNSKGIDINNNTHIGNRFTLISDCKISIGKRCLIGNDVKVYDSDFHSTAINRRALDSLKGAVKIGNNVFIGDNAIILKGVEIGDNAVVGAGSIVSKNVNENEIVAGNPAVKIKTIHEI